MENCSLALFVDLNESLKMGKKIFSLQRENRKKIFLRNIIVEQTAEASPRHVHCTSR